MNDIDRTQRGKGMQQKSTSESGGYLGWFVLEIAPIPIGLLIGSADIFDSYRRGPKGLFVFFLIITLACSLTGGIGQFGGYRAKRISKIALGCFAGLWIAAFDLSVVCFAGCCSAISQIGR
jgi:hypothetical protein